MYRMVFAGVLLVAAQTAYGEETISKTQNVSDTPGSNHRQLVSMPAQARELMRRDMLDTCLH